MEQESDGAWLPSVIDSRPPALTLTWVHYVQAWGAVRGNPDLHEGEPLRLLAYLRGRYKMETARQRKTLARLLCTFPDATLAGAAPLRE